MNIVFQSYKDYNRFCSEFTGEIMHVGESLVLVDIYDEHLTENVKPFFKKYVKGDNGGFDMKTGASEIFELNL